ncbi:MAG: DUF6291 domain-containing protein [Oscillospiraceae bacterium]|nr:DUF6291 domain-containing protein [Oscillospiraceae bacterium]
MAQRSGVLLYFDIRPVIEKLDDASAGALFKSILNYAENAVAPDFAENEKLDLVWAMLQPRIDKDAENYQGKCKNKGYGAYTREERRHGRKPLSRDDWQNTTAPEPDITYQMTSNDDFDYQTTSFDTNSTTAQHQNNSTQLQRKSNTEQNNTGSAAAAPLETLPPPSSVNEVRTFADRENLPDDSEQFFNHYAGLGWKNGSNQTPIANWQCFYRKWVNNKWFESKSAESAAAPPENIDWNKERRRMASVYAVLSGERDT